MKRPGAPLAIAAAALVAALVVATLADPSVMRRAAIRALAIPSGRVRLWSLERLLSAWMTDYPDARPVAVLRARWWREDGRRAFLFVRFRAAAGGEVLVVFDARGKRYCAIDHEERESEEEAVAFLREAKLVDGVFEPE